MTAPVPDHAALPVEELRRRLMAGAGRAHTPRCTRCLRDDVGDARFGGYCAGCDDLHLYSCHPERPCSGCREVDES